MVIIFVDNTFKYIAWNKNFCILIQVSCFLCKDLIDDKGTSHCLYQWCPKFLPLIPYLITNPQWVNSLQLSDTIWWHWTGSTLAQVMAWCTNIDLWQFHKRHPRPSIIKFSLKITYLKFHLILPRVNVFRKHWNIVIVTFLSFFDTEMVYVVEILPHGRQGAVYPM